MVSILNTWTRKIPAWGIYALVALWAIFLFWQANSGRMGAEPINALMREYGELALIFIVLSLAITPLRNFTGINLMKFRRAVGVSAFFLILAHLLVWAILDMQSLERIILSISRRMYIIVGLVGFALLVPLALTSNNFSVRRIKPIVWRRIHKLTYVAAIVGTIHYIMLTKGFPIEPLIYLAIILLLLILRFVWWIRKRLAT